MRSWVCSRVHPNLLVGIILASVAEQVVVVVLFDGAMTGFLLCLDQLQQCQGFGCIHAIVVPLQSGMENCSMVINAQYIIRKDAGVLT